MMLNKKVVHAQYNLDYAGLHRMLHTVKQSSGLKRAQSTQCMFGETRTFAEILDQEVEKVVLFYIREQGSIAKNAWEARSSQLSQLQDCSISLQKVDELLERFRDLGEQILDLLEYLEDNVSRLRTIIQKHDACFDQKLGSVYFDTHLGKASKSAHLLPLYHQDGIRAILNTVRRGFEEIYEARNTLQGGNETLFLSNSVLSSSRKDVPRISFGNRLASANNLQSLVSASTSIRPLASNPRHKSTNSLFNMMRTMSDPPQFQPIERSVSDLEPILNRINTVAERVLLTQKQSVLEVLAASSGMALEASLDDLQSSSDGLTPQEIENIQDKVARFLTSSSGLYINLLITFIYLANQYVVAPTSGEYAKLLGMTPAMSGVIIGMCPAAALVSSLLYSMWSNYSFKQPILTCIVCGVMGNLAYAMALQCDSAYLLILGRLLTGFGGPRVISRRYIADHVPQEKRLLASSQFVTAGALGLACGPLISSLVERSGLQFRWITGALFGGGSPWTLLQYQAETAPGWIMAAMWLVSLLLVLLFFKEPEAQYMRASKMHRNGASIYQNLGTLATNKQTEQPPRRSSFTQYNNTALDSAGPSSRNSNASLASQRGDSRAMSPMNVTSTASTSNVFNWSQQGMVAAPSVKLHDFTGIEMGSVLNNQSNSRFPGVASERSPLLSAQQAPAYDHYTYEESPTPLALSGTVTEAPRLWDCMTAEVLVILVLYTVNKTGQELVVSSIPLLTADIFHWSHEDGGYYMAVVGAMVLPMIVLVNRLLVADVEERDMVLHLCYASLASIVLLLHTGLLGEYILLQYIAGSVTLFASLNAMEGIIMALLAKVIAPELAKGTFNSALLATETGTFGRVIGDVFITVFGAASVPVMMVNQLFFPLAVMVIVSLGLVHWYFDRLM